MKRNGTVIETYTGLYLDFLNPSPRQINLDDIARGLAMTCRFGGQVSKFYSVAEHAVRVAEDVWTVTLNPTLALAALHHDSHEAYMGDWPTPLKNVLGGEFARVSDRIDRAIAKAFGIDSADFDHPEVKAADDRALRAEASWLKRSRGCGPHWGNNVVVMERPHCWSPERAEWEFSIEHDAMTKVKERQCLPT